MKQPSLWFCTTIVSVVVFVDALVGVASSQERVSDQLALARICASEVGLTGSAEECAAIASVLRRRAELRGWSFSGAARSYSSSVFDRSRTDGRAWVTSLRVDGREPSRWPATVIVRRGGEERVVPHAPWAAFRSRWQRLYADAGRVLAGEITSACGEQVIDHWGMRSGVDLERAQRAGWEEARCLLSDGRPTRNAFWTVPRVDVD